MKNKKGFTLIELLALLVVLTNNYTYYYKNSKKYERKLI